MKRTFLALALGIGALACAPEDVVVAELPARPDGGVHEPEHCIEDDDCRDPSAFCAKPTCTSQTGTCEIRPTFCDNARSTVCGCDGINYWNDCLRRQAGALLNTAGECSTLDIKRCGGPSGATCPVSGASCTRIYPPRLQCDPDGPGICWMLPTSCPPDDGPPVQACGGPGAPCVGRCAAMRTQKPHHETDPMMCH